MPLCTPQPATLVVNSSSFHGTLGLLQTTLSVNLCHQFHSPCGFAPLFPSQSPTEREWGPQQSTFHAFCDGSCLPCSDSTCLPCGNSTGSNASGMLSWGFPPHCGLSFSVIIDSRAMIHSPPFAQISCCLLSQPTVLSFKALQVVPSNGCFHCLMDNQQCSTSWHIMSQKPIDDS